MADRSALSPTPGRIDSALLVAALRRRVEAAGGFATVVAKGDPHSGTILLHCTEKGADTGIFERISGLDGRYRLESCGPTSTAGAKELDEYIQRRMSRDPDLWVVELDIADAQRFAAETIC